MSKIKCPNPKHNDENPSAHIYEDGIYCFSCGYYEKGEYEAERKQPEELLGKVEYIKSLSIHRIRGLDLPADDYGYYILWPDSNFYKLRTFNGTRYLAPKGHQQPLLLLEGKNKDLVIVEGELNAMSLKKVFPDLTVCSPGSATQLSVHYSKYLNLTNNNVIVIVDKDPAGVSAGISLKKELLKKRKKVRLIACERDLNEILQKDGEEGIKTWAKENLAL